jgi:asparagine synthase (glutamine-hydrolysing)
MQAGFCVLVRDGRAELQFFGRRPGEPRSLVSHARHGEAHAILMGRLTYRAELLGRLPREAAGPDVEDDAALAAYRHGGADALARLEGIFALVVWDAGRRLLLGRRDPLGGYPLFWASHGGTLAVGTGLGPLLRLLPRRRLNLDYVADFLAAPGAWVKEVVTDGGPYEGIHRLPPGSTLRADAPRGTVREHAQWHWPEHAVDPGTNRLEDLSALVEEGLRRAVREGLRGRVAAHASGGIDSSSVALLARDGLGAAPGRPPVQAISAVFDRIGGLARETPYMEAVLCQPGLAGHRVPCDDVLAYDGFANPPWHDEPCVALPVLGVQARLMEAAAEAGADTLLTGDGGDLLFDILPHHVTDLLRRGRLLAAWRVARAWGRAGNSSAWGFLWEYGLANLVPAALRAGPGAFWRGGRAAWERQGPGTVAPWVRPEFARTHGLRERALAAVGAVAPSGRPMNVAFLLSALRWSGGDPVRWWLSAPRGIHLVHPFFDPRLVGLCLGIHRRFRQRPDAPKQLLLRAMRDVLPDEVRNRKFKSDYNAVYQAGLSRNLPHLEALVRQPAVEDLGLFDTRELLRCLREAPLGRVTAHHALSRLHVTLAFLRWYSLQGEWQAPRPAAVVRVPAPCRERPCREVSPC